MPQPQDVAAPLLARLLSDGALPHGDVAHRLDPSMMAASALVVLATMLAAGAGIGGGGLLVPIYILVARLDPKAALPLSRVQPRAAVEAIAMRSAASAPDTTVVTRA